jgi:type IX secretion system PorP/SprF family membrane protein
MAFAILAHVQTHAQDPSFSQFFSSPLNINPAQTGNINSEWRAISNFRDQWAGPVYPYLTGTISFDTRILRDKLPENNSLGVGMMMMYDKSMGGVLKSNYASLNAAYNVQFAESDIGGAHRIGLGIGGIYGNRRVDYSRLVFGEQFNGVGFDRNLPTGESALGQMKPYFSVSTGLLYTYTTEFTDLDIGFSGFHLNKPKQSFLADENQILPVRWVGHADFSHLLSDGMTVINTNAVYQRQSTTSYFSVGGAVGRYLSQDDNIMVNAGLWYWSNNALIPYFGFTYKSFQVGVTYDLTVSKLAAGQRRPNTFEISLILRGEKRNGGVIPCPWK